MSESDPDSSAAENAEAVSPNATPHGGMVRVARYATEIQASLSAALAGEDIPSQIFGANANNVMGLYYQGITDVELHVPADCAERAAELLDKAASGDLEPADSPPPTDESGNELVPAADFDTFGALRDAQTVLASARIKSVLPALAPRAKDKVHAASGLPVRVKRFFLYVTQGDLERAQSLLDQQTEDDDDEPRCPKCGARRTHPIFSFWKIAAAVVGLGFKPKRTIECLACHYRGDAAEFHA